MFSRLPMGKSHKLMIFPHRIPPATTPKNNQINKTGYMYLLKKNLENFTVNCYISVPFYCLARFMPSR